MLGTSGQDEGMGKHGLFPHTTTAKITTRLQNNYHSEPSEYQAIWKSFKLKERRETIVLESQTDL